MTDTGNKGQVLVPELSRITKSLCKAIVGRLPVTASPALKLSEPPLRPAAANHLRFSDLVIKADSGLSLVSGCIDAMMQGTIVSEAQAMLMFNNI